MGNKNILDKSKKLNFLKGHKWSKDNVGTNAIGTCLYLNKPIQTLGAEHYCKEQHSWICSAAPIHDNKGNIIGVINLSGDFYDFHTHTLAIVVAAANAIQNQLAIIEHKKWIEVAYNSIESGILVIGKNYRIKDFNEKICTLLQISKNELLNIDVKKMLKEIIVNCNIFDNSNVIKYREIGLHVGKNRIECSLKISPVVKNNHHLGVVLVARKLDSIRSDVTKIAGYSSTYTFDNIITKNHNMLSLINTAKKIAMNDCPVLIQGESGTGKELFAHSLHNASPRHKGPFIAINCAALPKDLVESELFGYERGAFTGAAKEGNPGKFELANRGTIFLDEIGELPLDIQAKLLRVLDNYEITRLGGKNKRKLDIRIITATNRNLSEEVLIKNFRQDLFYD